MKRLLRLYDEDLRKMVMEQYDVRPSQVTSVFTEEVVGNSDKRTEPVFYIEVELDE